MKMPRNMKALVVEISHRNGRKKKGDLFQQTEDLAHLCDILWEWPITVAAILFKNAVRRNKKRGGGR